MLNPMVTINEDYQTFDKGLYGPRSCRRMSRTSEQRDGHKNPPLAHGIYPTPTSSMTEAVDTVTPYENGEIHHEHEGFEVSRFFDMPLLVSDDDEEDSDGELAGSKNSNEQFDNATNKSFDVAQEVKKSIKQDNDECIKASQNSEKSGECLQNSDSTIKVEEDAVVTSADSNAKIPSATPVDKKNTELTAETFDTERNKVMKIIVKYVSMKIKNSFPPQSARTHNPDEMPLDQFMMVLVSRLQLPLNLFMKGIIYLFRYMDIVYLLRYLNQSNNFANYNDMGYDLKKLMIGCYRLVLARERITKNWSGITGLRNREINDVVRTLVGRLNGKLVIKDLELVRLRSEIFRFVKMVTKAY